MATVNRKNKGKQYTCVDESRFIFHWHRPGDPLPVLIKHQGVPYLLTQEVIQKALVDGRANLAKVDLSVLPRVEKEILAETPVQNRKGAYVWVLNGGSTWDVVKAVASYVAVGGVALWAVNEIAKALA